MSAADPLADALARSPELFPHALDLGRETATLLRLSRADYEEASFLDGRIGGPTRPARSLPFLQLADAVETAALQQSCYFIFHIGHVGSTLLSRLLGRHPALFCLREPDILRTLALAQNASVAASHLPVFLKLWSRSWDAGARAVVKASSFVSDLAPEILARDYAPRALVMGVAPETYLATIFGGANAPTEARALAPFRLARLRKRLGCNWQLGDFSEGELVALGWLCETSALAVAVQQAGARVLVIDFEAFLSKSRNVLARAFDHFGAAVTTQEVDNILAGPEMRTYSKAPEFAYDAQLRRAVLEEGRARRATEIRLGLSWLDRAARKFPQLQSAFALFDVLHRLY
ncbi:MAG: hypothetical protein ACREHV_09465 [Rhizomicrobium sp.]